ncbi:hypothetical protein STEG23_026891 [Scotinomys teguina]
MVLLVTMAYDRYVAICRPLHYTSIMDRQKCIWLVVISWIIGFVHAISQLILILELPFCGPRVIDSFFCDIPLVMKLACMDTDTLEIVINADSGVLATTCFIILLISYTYILLTVQLHSKDGSSKALSTCTSHIIVVVLFFGPVIFIYLWPVNTTWVDKFLAVFYSVITPLLNPAIYTLRNRDIKNAIKKLINHNIILGNLFIVFLAITDTYLQSPMYFLLSNLSLIDVGLSSTTIPKMISDLLKEHKVISFHNCMTQICFIHIMGGVEMVLLIAMAFDRYTAICKPLHCLSIMSPKICISFVITGWVTGVIHALSQFSFVISLPFCGLNKLDSFYCDFPRIIQLACTDGDKLEFVIAANSGFMSTGTFFLLLLSYVFILVTVWKRSSGDLSKALVTLSSHITVVVLFFTPCMFLYVWPFPTSSVDKYLFIADFAVTPALNPVIYALRNKDMKETIKNLSKQIRYIRFF